MFWYFQFKIQFIKLKQLQSRKVLFCHENLPLMSCEYEYTVFPPIRPVGLILSYFGNAGTISEQGSISVVTISWLFAKFLSYLTKKH